MSQQYIWRATNTLLGWGQTRLEQEVHDNSEHQDSLSPGSVPSQACDLVSEVPASLPLNDLGNRRAHNLLKRYKWQKSNLSLNCSHLHTLLANSNRVWLDILISCSHVSMVSLLQVWTWADSFSTAVLDQPWHGAAKTMLSVNTVQVNGYKFGTLIKSPLCAGVCNFHVWGHWFHCLHGHFSFWS